MDREITELIPNRRGVVTEYKRGHYYLTITEFEDGHCEIEVHRCIPELVYHSCDIKDRQVAIEAFNISADKEMSFQKDIVEKMSAELMLQENGVEWIEK
jgi:hypothetical protein